MTTMQSGLVEERYDRLSRFLKERRQRITPSSRSLGSHKRLPSRHGRRVTQEELAEAIGVSRTWYGLLESGATIRVSPRLLDRLAFALMLTAHERTALFFLAVPELLGTQPYYGSETVREDRSEAVAAERAKLAETTG